MCTKFTSPRKFAFTTVLLLFWTRPCLGNSGTFGIRVDKESDRKFQNNNFFCVAVEFFGHIFA